MTESATSTAATEEVKLTPAQVAARYNGNLSVRTLANWRVTGGGPKFVKIGGKVMYKLSDVLTWEAKRNFGSTSEYTRSN